MNSTAKPVPRTRCTGEILQSYEEFCGEMKEFEKRIQAAATDKRQQHTVGPMITEYSTSLQSKTLETWVEIAAQLAELNAQLRNGWIPKVPEP